MYVSATRVAVKWSGGVNWQKMNPCEWILWFWVLLWRGHQKCCKEMHNRTRRVYECLLCTLNFFLKHFVLWKCLKWFTFFSHYFLSFSFFQYKPFCYGMLDTWSVKIWGFGSLCGPYSRFFFLLLFNKSWFFSGSLWNICFCPHDQFVWCRLHSIPQCTVLFMLLHGWKWKFKKISVFRGFFSLIK